MANVANYQKIEQTFTNVPQVARFTYDFAEDGGSTGSYTLGSPDKKIVMLRGWFHVETACTSGGSATVKIGFTTADDDAILDTTSGAVANLVDDLVGTETAATNLVVAADDPLVLVIGAEALTAGKINVYVEYLSID